MLSSTDHLRLICFTTVICTFSLITRAEEIPAEKIQPEEVHSAAVNKSGLAFEADPYYTNIGYNIPLTSEPVPTITSDSEAVIYAIKMFPMNVFITPEVMDHVLECIIAARDEVMATQDVKK